MDVLGAFFNWLSTLATGFVVLMIAYLVVRSRYKKAGPDEALIVFGGLRLFSRKVASDSGVDESYRIVRGGGTFIWPAWESYDRLSLRIMTLEINQPHVYTEQGIPINVKAVAQVKVSSSPDQICRAAGAFLGMEVNAVQATIQETVAGHLRGIIGTLTVEQLYRDQRSFQEKVREEAHRDLEGMGFEFKSFVFQEIQDNEGYLDALGQSKIQEALKRARIATAEADRDAQIEEESARRAKEQQRFAVDTEIAESEKALSLKNAAIREEVDVAEATAIKAGEMELKQQDIRIAEQEVEHQKLELNATVRECSGRRTANAVERSSEADKYRIETGAIAERCRREEIAEAVQGRGRGDAGKGRGGGEGAPPARRGAQALQRGRSFDRGAQGVARHRGGNLGAAFASRRDHDHQQRQRCGFGHGRGQAHRGRGPGHDSTRAHPEAARRRRDGRLSARYRGATTSRGRRLEDARLR